MIRSATRTRTGQSLVDLGPVLWFLLLCLVFPLLDLGCVALRYTFALGACRDAAQQASMAKTYLVALDAADPSAVEAASTQATLNCNSFSGVKLISVQTNLLITDLATNTVTQQSVPVSGIPNSSANLYQIQVVLTANVNPLVTYTGHFMGNIPGLTGPMKFVITSTQMTENPSGMNQ